MTRKYFLLLCYYLFFSLGSRFSLAQTIPIQPQVRQFLGNNASTILAEAEIVEVFQLEPFPKSKSNTSFNGFNILKKNTLSLNKVYSIKKILGNDANYGFDEFMKNCTFTPSLGIRFRKQDKVLDVLVCFDCDVWRFVGEQLDKTEDFDPAHQQMKSFYLTAFL